MAAIGAERSMPAMTDQTDPVPADAVRARVAFFGHDCTESTVIKRARAFTALGIRVLGFTFRRVKFNRDYRPEWDDLSLGTTVDHRFDQRILRMLQALPKLWRARARLAAADFFYARNLDMCALALFGRWVAGSKAPLVYEVLDVHLMFTRGGLASAVFRQLERLVLARTQLLVVSSPAFLGHYFAPIQGYAGPSFLLENKIFELPRQYREQRPTPDSPRGPACPPDQPWIIAWLGNLRCPRSLGLLTQIAERMGERVEIRIHGYPTEIGVEALEAAIAPHPNIRYFGEYRSPEDLQVIYDQVHFAWAFDYLEAGANSVWLLPNRLYEGCYFGAPALAAKGTETGRRVEAEQMGWTFDEPIVAPVVGFLETLDPLTYLRTRRHLLSLPETMFLDDGDMARLVERILPGRYEVAVG